MNSMRMIAAGAAVAVVAAAALTLAPTQSVKADHAMGHCDTAIHHPTDPDAFGSGRPNSYACEWFNHWFRVCDRSVDGHRVFAVYRPQFARTRWFATGAAPSQGCHTQGTGPSDGNIIEYTVCVEHEGCPKPRPPY